MQTLKKALLLFLLFMEFSTFTFSQSNEAIVLDVDWLNQEEIEEESITKLITFLESQKGSTHLWLVVANYYQTQANQSNPFTQVSLANNALDSAIFCYKKVKDSAQKSNIRKHSDYYERYLAFSSHSIDDLMAMVEKNVTGLSLKKSGLKATQAKFNKAVEYYNLAQSTFEEVNATFETKDSYLVLSHQQFAETFIPIAYHYSQAITLIEHAKNIARNSFSNLPSISIASSPKAMLVHGNAIEVYDFQAWYNHLLKERETKSKPLQQALVLALQELMDNPNSALPSTNSTLTRWKSNATDDDLLAAIIRYWETKKILQNNRLQASETVKNERVSLFTTSFKAKNTIAVLNKQLQIITEALAMNQWEKYNEILTPIFRAESQFQALIHKEKERLEAQEIAFSKAVKEQLLSENVTLKHLPKYISYGGSPIPLFEQPIDLVVEQGDFVTTQLFQCKSGAIFLTGYRREKQRKGFIAKVSNNAVEWVRWAKDKPLDNKKSHHSFGVTLSSKKNGGCIVIMQYQTDHNSSNQSFSELLSVDGAGNFEHQFNLKTKTDISTIVPFTSIQDSSTNFLTASLGNITVEEMNYMLKWPKRSASNSSVRKKIPLMKSPQARKENYQQTQQNALIVKQFDTQGDSQWTLNIPMSGSISSIMEKDETFLLVCNESAGAKNHVQLILVDKNGKIRNKKNVVLPDNWFALKTLSIDEKRTLIVGFQGDYDMNTLEKKKVINVVVDDQLNLIDTNIERP